MKYVLCLLICLTAMLSVGQNLVPNPSFDSDSCYWGDGDTLVPGWKNYLITPDYLHSDCISTFGMPSNAYGFQYARTGEGMAGIVTSSTYGSSFPCYPNCREIIGSQLTQPLQIGSTYTVSFFVSNSNWFSVACDKIGIKFSTVDYSMPASQLINNFGHIYVDSVVTDSIGWTGISSTFIADSAYNYILIANFFDNFQTTVLNPGGITDYEVYYYLDDVSVSLTKGTGMSNDHGLVDFSIYPNPSRQAVNLTLPQGTTQIEIFNAVGQSVYTSNVTSLHQAVDVSLFSEGIYFVRVQSHQGVQTQKFVVQR